MPSSFFYLGERQKRIQKFGLLVKDLKYLECKFFELKNATKKGKGEFKITELPNDMKMLYFLTGELSNSAANFTTFANANEGETNNYKKSNILGDLFLILKRSMMQLK